MTRSWKNLPNADLSNLIQYRRFMSSKTLRKKEPPTKTVFDQSFENARQSYPEVEKHWHKALDDVTPLRTLRLFQNISLPDCELLGMNDGRPDMLIWQHIPCPPVTIRPSVPSLDSGGTTEDELTATLSTIIHTSNQLRRKIFDGGTTTTHIYQYWDALQIQLALVFL